MLHLGDVGEDLQSGVYRIQMAPMLTVEIEGEKYVRAAPGYSPVKAKKPHVTEKYWPT